MNSQPPIFSSEEASADTVSTLVNNLRLALNDGAAEQDQEALALSWRGTADTLALLHRVLAGFLHYHAELYHHLAVAHRMHAGSYADVHSPAQQFQPMLISDIEGVDELWSGLGKLDKRSQLYMSNVFSSQENPKEGQAITLDLAKAIAWIYGAIEPLRQSFSRLEQARGVLAPVLRLNEDILVLILELLAASETPTKKSLGWIRLSHVCSTWRQTLLNKSDLWARDAYTLGPYVARAILPYVRNGLVSVAQSRPPLIKIPFNWKSGLVPILYKKDIELLEFLANNGTVRDMNICCAYYNIPGLLRRILGKSPLPYLRTLNVLVLEKPAGTGMLGTQTPMASHPSLEHVEFMNAFIPFSLPRLVSLHLSSTNQNNMYMSQKAFNVFFDCLESSPTLRELRVHPWFIPEQPSDDSRRRITLPNLEILVTYDVKLSDMLHLPKLSTLGLHVHGRPLPLQAALDTAFRHHSLPLRSMQVSQRLQERSSNDMLVVQFGRMSSNCPPPAQLPLEPAQYDYKREPVVTFMVPVEKSRSRRPISGLFAHACEFVHEMAGVHAPETLGFDNETREQTFFDTSSQTTYYPMYIPPFPSVRKVELPLRDSDSTYHLLTSLCKDENITNLPALKCLMFRGPLDDACFHLEVRLMTVLRRLLRARASRDVTSITSLELELVAHDIPEPSSSALTHGTKHESIKLEQLKQAINIVIAGMPELQAAVAFQEEYLDIPKTNHLGVRVLATIIYEPALASD